MLVIEIHDNDILKDSRFLDLFSKKDDFKRSLEPKKGDISENSNGACGLKLRKLQRNLLPPIESILQTQIN